MLLVEHIDFYFGDNIMGSILPCEITNTPGDGEKRRCCDDNRLLQKKKLLAALRTLRTEASMYLPAQRVDH